MIQPAHLPPLRQTQRQTLSKHQLKVDKHNNNSTCLSFIYHDYVGWKWNFSKRKAVGQCKFVVPGAKPPIKIFDLRTCPKQKKDVFWVLIF